MSTTTAQLGSGDALRTKGPMDVELELTVRLGSTELSLAEVGQLTEGLVLGLDRSVDDPVDLLFNGQLVARGEVAIEADGPVIVITEVVE